MKGLVYETSVLDPEEVSIRATENTLIYYCRSISACVCWYIYIFKKKKGGGVARPRCHTRFEVV